MRSRFLAASLLASLTVIGIAQAPAAAATNFDVTASSMLAYHIGGADNPTLTLTRGQTYTFNIQVVAHPFWITTMRGSSEAEASQFTEGVTDNGASPGMITFVVPASAPATLYYQCAYHDPMGGTLQIVSPAATALSVPSLGPLTLAGLAGLLLLIALAISSKLNRA